MKAKLNSKGEELWQDIRQHLDWNDGFALIFYFASNVTLTDIFKQRLQQFFIIHTTRLQEIHYQPDDSDWLHNTMLKLLNRDDNWRILNAPVWVALHHTQDKQALEQYSQLLMRLNERRDVWRKAYPAPMMFILPESFKETIAGLVPDLWSIRVMAEKLDQTLLLTQEPAANSSQEINQQIERFPIPSEQQASIDEWLRLESKGEVVSFERVRVGRRALDVWLKYGWLDQAEAVENKILAWSRKLSEDETPESLRDLSVSLERLGDVAQQQGRMGEAESAYEESLVISRRLKELLGDTPESLRDLAVSLSKLGDPFEVKTDLAQAENCYQEGLALGKRLTKMLPDLPAYTEIEAFFRQRLDALADPDV